MATPRRKPTPSEAAAGAVGMGAGNYRGGGLTKISSVGRVPRGHDTTKLDQPVRKYVDVSDNPAWLALELQLERFRRGVERWGQKELDANTAMRNIANSRNVEGLLFRLFHSNPQGQIDVNRLAKHFGVTPEFIDANFRHPRGHSVTIQRITGRRRK